MLLKCSNMEKRFVTNGKGKARGFTSRIHRKTLKIPSKKHPGKRISPGKNSKILPGKNYPPATSSICDNSNDSGLGFEQHLESHASMTINNINNNINYHRPLSTLRYNDLIIQSTISQKEATSIIDTAVISEKKIKFDGRSDLVLNTTKDVTAACQLRSGIENACSSDDFFLHYKKSNDPSTKLNQCASSPEIQYHQSSPGKRSLSSSGSECLSSPTSDSPSSSVTSSPDINCTPISSVIPSLNHQFPQNTRNGTVSLQIITQPEQQHRARYQTEGSRGAVKDRSGNGFPVVKLNGYNKPTILQVFIGNDIGKVSPHIFYQACKVSGKNSTPCTETKTEGTMVIEIELKPENDMTVICDCVGILKERNVDVEHRLGRDHTLATTVTRNKKKSTKCRMVFRAQIGDTTEIVQICSNTITCTQPPGVPEICKKSLDSCTVAGGQELFIIGKNFLKDTKVIFTKYSSNSANETRQPKKVWEEIVQPDKEYLQQTHLICMVPPFPNCDAQQDPVNVQIYVTSSNKRSEPHSFMYMPFDKNTSPTQDESLLFGQLPDTKPHLLMQWTEPQLQQNTIIDLNTGSTGLMMPPPLNVPRRSSFSNKLTDANADLTVSSTIQTLKTEFIDQTTSSQDLSITTSSSNSLAVVPLAVKEMIFNDTSMLDVGNMQIPYGQTVSSSVVTQSQAVDLIQAVENSGQVVVDQLINFIAQTTDQQQLITNTQQLINDSTLNNHHISQDMILNSQSNNNVTMQSQVDVMNVEQCQQQELTVSPLSSNIILNSSISPTEMCEQNLLAVQMVEPEGTAMLSMQHPIESTNEANTDVTENNLAAMNLSATSPVAVKRIMAEILPPNTAENFISTMPAPPTISEAQEMLGQGFSEAVPSIKKEQTNVQVQVDTSNLINMSENDLISYINPSVFM